MASEESPTTVQNNIISSSSDMDQLEPPVKKKKIESESNSGLGNEVAKESETIEKDESPVSGNNDSLENKNDSPVKTSTTTTTSNTGSENINISNGNEIDVLKLPTRTSSQGTSENDQTVKPTTKESKPLSAEQEIDAKKDKKSENSDPDDPIAGLDWKDGIATLPGSNLKFKMTEFGTLEIVSTVETEKGEVEMSTSTDQTKVDINAQETAKNNETSTQVSVIKTSKDAKSKTPTKSDIMKGPPDAGHFLCCEVCGKYGLPKDFSASGRFCSLKCVGMYTGRRNKGREFVRHVKTLDGKIIKKRKKKAPSTTETPAEGQTGQLNVVKNESEANKDSVPVTIKKIKGTKKKIKRIHLDAASLASTDNVPYDSSKPFIWVDYLCASNSKAVPVSVFQQENPELNMFPKPCPENIKGMKLEAIDPKHPSYICVCTVVRVRGARLRLHFDGWSESYDFWTNADSPFIFPVGWCDKHGQTLSAPRGVPASEFDFESYIKNQGSEAVPSNLFKQVSQTRHGFEIDMKLEAIDRKNPDLICVATVTNVIGNRFLVHFDEWDDTYDYWCEEDSPYIHPVGWCEANGGKLNPPNDDEVDTFTWAEYLKTTGTVAASPELFKKRFAPGYKIGQKLEAVDKRNPSLIRAATVADLEEYKVKLHFDGWDDLYDEWYDADSTDVHPVSYCEKTGHPLEAPLSTHLTLHVIHHFPYIGSLVKHKTFSRGSKISSAACPTPGCKGIGHVKGAKYASHHSTFGCPYSLQNLNKESCLVDRLSTNSMTEESDWSYGKREKPPSGRDRKDDEPPSPNSVTSPTPSFDGSSFVPAHWKSKSISTGGPRNDSSRSARNSHRSTSAFSTKMSSSNTSAVGTSYATNNINNRPIPRRHSFKEEKPSAMRPKFVEKGIQYISPYYNTWGYGFTKLPVNGRREFYSLHDEKPSKEKLEMGKWTVEQVEKHVRSLGCTEQAKLFEQQEIDGEAFLLLTQPDIVNIMKIKLGPALKIFNSIPKH